MSRVGRHLARHTILYGIGLAWLLAVVAFPTVPIPLAGSGDVTLPPEMGSATPGTGPGSSTAALDVGSDAERAAGGSTNAAGGATTRSPGSTVPQAAGGTPLTRTGVPCRPGVPQLADSDYSPPCVPAFVGDNGGATSRGVTATEIRVIYRYFDDNPLIGVPPSAATRRALDVFLKHLNATMELYGRRVVVDFVKSAAGNSVEEAQGRGRDGACQDAAEYAQERRAFGVYYADSAPFADCAAEQGLVVFDVQGVQPERLFARRHPYLWTLERPCERLADQIVEYMGKRLVGRKATLGGPDVASKQRKIGVYVPDNEAYQQCISGGLEMLEHTYGHKAERYDYVIDVTRLADQAAQAVARFKSAGVTTVLLSCDTLSAQFLMASADSQNWHPEWVYAINSWVGNDALVREWSAAQTRHLFGVMDVPVDTVYFSPTNEPARVYKALTGESLGAAEFWRWSEIMHVFRLLQAGGPHLTPQSVGTGALSLPAVTGFHGRWSFRVGVHGEPNQPSHGAILDGTEVWWDPTATSFDGSAGAFRPGSGGKWFETGQWPTTEVERR